MKAVFHLTLSCLALITVWTPNNATLTLKELEKKFQDFHNATVVELEERIDDLEAQLLVLQESQVVQAGQIQAIRDEVDDVADETDELDDRTDALENRDIQHDYQFTQVADQVEELDTVDSALSSRITTLENKVNAPLQSCSSTPCSNGASCVDITTDKFVCSCKAGYHGPLCENSYNDASFLAGFSASTMSLDVGIMIFDEVVNNLGNNYNPVTGYYTAPYNGTYEIFYSIAVSEAQPMIYVLIEGEYYSYNSHYVGSTSTSYQNSQPVYITAHLDEGQVVNLENDLASCYIWGYYSSVRASWFGINLLYED